MTASIPRNMNRRTLHAISLGLAVTGMLGGCLPVAVRDRYWHEVPATSEGQAAAESGDRLRVDDTVRVVTQEGELHTYRIYRLEPKAFYGTRSDGRKFRVGYAALSSIEVLREDNSIRMVAVPVVVVGDVGPDISMSPRASAPTSAGSFGFGALAPLGVLLLGRRRRICG